MVIEKVHGLQATSISLNDRFSMLASAAPDRVAVQRRRPSFGSAFTPGLNLRNRNLVEQIARRLEQRAKLRQGVRQRIGNQNGVPGLRRSNSFGNLSQRSMKSRGSWRQSNGDLSRSVSFGNLSDGTWHGQPLRGFRRRGGGQRALRGRFRGGRQTNGRITRVSQRGRRGRTRLQLVRGGGGGGAGGGAGRGARGNVRTAARGASRGTRGNALRGTASRGRGRGGITRNQTPKPVPTKEELDAQLDQYMAGTKAALDKELEAYMKSAMEME